MKVVFILGAGFSVSAGAPAQNAIMSEIFKLKDHFGEEIKVFEEFLSEQLAISPGQFENVALEDIFTPLDRCLSESAQYRGILMRDMVNVREDLFHVIRRTIHLVLEQTNKKKDYIDKFAEYIVNLSKKRQGQHKQLDPVSVISTNWDILLDRSLYNCIRIRREKAVVDYCCYISSLGMDDDTVKPGLEMIGKGGFNVKLLKLHGSLNWLQCPRCMRIYVTFDGKLGVERASNGSCRHCDRNFPEEDGNHKLISNLIMPTFIKDLSNPQYKVIWQNAGIEISEADKLVFIGYSLPLADFEMRQLLSRMTRKNAKIEIVDYCGEEDADKKMDLEKRWRAFFGKREIQFFFQGASAYIDTLTTKIA